MAKESSSARKRGSEPTPDETFDLATFGQANMDAFLQAGQAMLRGVSALNEEFMAFANMRLENNVKTGRSLSDCDSVEQALEVQRDYARAATEDYFAQATKLLNLGVQMTRESWAPFETQTTTALDELGKPKS